ncbi:CoA-transferase family III domain-containing protein [Crucibulum laeve]|uniref:CoA-transferase family III domain-containing protein n=1 Tax=Crucibulum laeve TaxID=68775 RepID=A0A5C3LN74_9AGAR|nr:CoA-transferase family III domain-containing protein [Crucibulum laeve]
MTVDSYSIPAESKKLLHDELVNNKLHNSAPKEIREAAKYIHYTGSRLPVVPINWRFAESVAAVKGYYGAMLNVLLKKKYGIPYQSISINTDHAQLFFMSIMLPTIDPYGEKITTNLTVNPELFEKYFPSCDIHDSMGPHVPAFDRACTNIYKTQDGRFYHLHLSMNHRPTQEALRVERDDEAKDIPSASRKYQERVSEWDALALDELINEKYRQAGTVCLTIEEYFASSHGKANAHVGLFEVHHIVNEKQKAGWWTPVEGKTTPSRPLFGLKVLEFTRAVASPIMGKELAEYGASVLRITSPKVADITVLNVEMGWGKWNAHLELTKEEDRDQLRALIQESDVVIDGYRPGAMEKWGFGKDDILALFENKDRGIVYARLNSYGWYGPWAHRSGWQHIADANTGIAWEFGRSMGLDEPVSPPFPNADFCTGVGGSIGILQALVQKAEFGGSFVIDVALNYFAQWLIRSCGVYPPGVWDMLWAKYDRAVSRSTDNMNVLLPRFMQMVKEKGTVVLNPEFFEDREDKAIGVPIRTIKPVLSFTDCLVKPGYNVGTRANGVDKARWPKDLLTEVVV